MTDRQLTEGCSVIQVAGHGDASRIADNGNLTLLRVFGASALTPAALVHEGASASALTLVGIADPQAQGGERAVTTVDRTPRGRRPRAAAAARLRRRRRARRQGRIFGMVTLKAPVLASAGATTLPAATVVPVDRHPQIPGLAIRHARDRPQPASRPRRRRWCG